MRIFLNIQYDGTNYHGWQIQPNSISVQETIEHALSILYKSQINVTGCGRTDTGVHASDYFLHFDTNIQLNISMHQLKYQLNGILPEDIKIISILKPVNNDINARHSPISRTYCYTIISEKDPFLTKYAFRYHGKLDLEIMNQACIILMEYSDFTSFSKTGTQVTTNICNILNAKWIQNGYIIKFTITADRFLRNMVRAITGTMLDIGRHKITLDDLRQIIEKKNRCYAGDSVPPQGLCLIRVDYGDIFSMLD